jgi:hypothetical protein
MAEPTSAEHMVVLWPRCCFCGKGIHGDEDECEQGSDAELSHVKCCPLCSEDAPPSGGTEEAAEKGGAE